MKPGKNFLAVVLLLTGMTTYWPAAQAQNIPDFGSVTNSPSATVRPGMMVWMDLLTEDVRGAANFYRDVFDWQFEFSEDGSYAYARLDGQPVASIAAYDEEVENGEGLWLPSISVPDVDAALDLVKSNGGVVLEPAEDLPGRGRYVLIKDPTGAVVMLLRASGGDPERSEPVNGWLWAELWTNHVDKAIGFYESVVGYRTVAVKGNTGSVYQVMGRDQQPHASVVKTPLPDVEPNWLVYLLVENVDATARAVLKAGGKVLLPPQGNDLNYDVAIVADPTGGVFGLQQREEKQ